MSELRDDAELRRAMKASERAAGAAALRVLRRELGPLRALAVVARVALDQARGEPFRHLDPPVDRRDELSRRQLGPAVLLHRALRRRLPVARAAALTSEIVEAGGLTFLGSLLGDLDPRTFAGEVGQEVRERVGRFFNAEGDVDAHGTKDGGQASFTVHRCRFVELAPEVGAQAILPTFCAVDRAYFRPELTPLRLERDHTLARGDRCCDFRFEWTG